MRVKECQSGMAEYNLSVQGIGDNRCNDLLDRLQLSQWCDHSLIV